MDLDDLKNDIYTELSLAQDHVLEILDASYGNPIQRGAVRKLVKRQFTETRDCMSAYFEDAAEEGIDSPEKT